MLTRTQRAIAWFRDLFPAHPSDPQLSVARLASGSVLMGLDLPRGTYVTIERMPPKNDSEWRLRVFVHPSACDAVADRLERAAGELRGKGV